MNQLNLLKPKRLFFIDIVRAFVILMMLQGHFIDALLDPKYRDLNSPFFFIWSYIRGITAPTFFTISGLIFTYLLLKARENGVEKLRIKKGVIRGAFLIFVGYLIRIPILDWLTGKFNTYFLIIDVLQCIGLGLILIIIIYILSLKKIWFFSIVCLFGCLFIFLTEPIYRNLQLNNLPVFLSNYLDKRNGSIFTILPWLGYVFFGAFLATIFNKNLQKKYFKTTIIIGFLVVGIILIFYSSYFLCEISKITKNSLFLDVANYNYLFTRLGNVCIYFSLFYGLENYLKFPLLLKIGQKTLSIYVIHFIIIYGSFTGIGLNLIGKILSPTQATLGAFFFLFTVCIISFYYVKTNTFLYNKLRNFLQKKRYK